MTSIAPKKVRTSGKKAKYVLAEGLCSVAGRAEHQVREGQTFDYRTLWAWMKSLRHEQPVQTWAPPVAATDAPSEPAKKSKRSKGTGNKPASSSSEASTPRNSILALLRRSSPTAQTDRTNGVLPIFRTFLGDVYRFSPIWFLDFFPTFLGDFDPGESDSRSLGQT